MVPFSVICVYNDKKTLEHYLLKNLRSQTVDYELILLDNTDGRYKSAAEALNYGGKKAKGKYLIFVHQDVDLCSGTWLERAQKILDSLPNLGIAGVAGTDERDSDAITKTIIKHGDPPRLAGRERIQKPEKVWTVDECLIIIPKSMFNILQFDENVCDDWHLYAADYCLSVRKLGLDVYVIPMFVYHKSTGSNKGYLQTILTLGHLPESYYRTLEKLLKKHKDYERIYVHGCVWSTKYPLILQRSWYVIKLVAKFIIKKIKKLTG